MNKVKEHMKKDRERGIKEGSKKDIEMDKKAGVYKAEMRMKKKK